MERRELQSIGKVKVVCGVRFLLLALFLNIPLLLTHHCSSINAESVYNCASLKKDIALHTATFLQ